MVVGDAGTILASVDSVIWQAVTSGITTALYGVTISNTQAVAVGAGGTIVTSATGDAWSPQISGTTLTLEAVSFSGTAFVAVGDSPTQAGVRTNGTRR